MAAHVGFDLVQQQELQPLGWLPNMYSAQLGSDSHCMGRRCMVGVGRLAAEGDPALAARGLHCNQGLHYEYLLK